MKTSTIPPKVLEALLHVQSVFPDVTQVFYGADGRWLYCDENFDSPVFGGTVDVCLLEDAQAQVEDLPNAYALT